MVPAMRALPLVALLAVSGCSKPAPPAPRATLLRTGGTTFQLIPGEGQFPWCLAYTVSRSGLTRQLTMSAKNQSFPCEAGVPIGKRTFRIPRNEGPVKIFVFFSTQPVNAAALSQDILDSKDRQALSVMNMRLPGQAALETLEFTPEDDVEAEEGSVLGVDAGTPETPDAGAN